jgi:hypothetical protein
MVDRVQPDDGMFPGNSPENVLRRRNVATPIIAENQKQNG